MSYRLVMPRRIPFADSNRVQQQVWRRGYGTRLAPRDSSRPGEVVVEFLRVVEELPEPSSVHTLEEELEHVLQAAPIHAQFTGHGAWLETIQRPPHAKA